MKIKSGQIWYDPGMDRLVLFGDKDLGGFKSPFMIYYFGMDSTEWCFLLAVYLDRLIYIGEL